MVAFVSTNKFLICVNITGNKTDSDSDSESKRPFNTILNMYFCCEIFTDFCEVTARRTFMLLVKFHFIYTLILFFMLKWENQIIHQAYFEEHLFVSLSNNCIACLDILAPTNKTTELWSQNYAFKNYLTRTYYWDI